MWQRESDARRCAALRGLLEVWLTSGPAVSVGGARRVLVDPDVGRGAVRRGERSRR